MKQVSTKKKAHPKHKIAGSRDQSAKQLKASDQKVLDFLALLSYGQISREVSRSLVAMQAKITLKTLNNSLTKLKKQGLVETHTGVSVSITLCGMEEANVEGRKLCATNQEHQQNTMETLKLTPKQRHLFKELADGRAKSKTDVATSIGTKNIKSFQNILITLKNIGIVAYDRNTVWLTDDMFVVQGRPGGTPTKQKIGA